MVKVPTAAGNGCVDGNHPPLLSRPLRKGQRRLSIAIDPLCRNDFAVRQDRKVFQAQVNANPAHRLPGWGSGHPMAMSRNQLLRRSWAKQVPSRIFPSGSGRECKPINVSLRRSGEFSGNLCRQSRKCTEASSPAKRRVFGSFRLWKKPRFFTNAWNLTLNGLRRGLHSARQYEGVKPRTTVG